MRLRKRSSASVVTLVVALVVALVGPVATTVGISPAQAASAKLHKQGEVTSGPLSAVCCGFTTEHFSSVAYGDVNGDGAADLVVGGLDGRIRAWTYGSPSPFLNLSLGSGGIHASPLLVDLTNDGVLDIVVGDSTGRLVALTGTGNVFFSVRDTGVQKSGFFSSPAVADLDRDGGLEIIATGFDHHIHAWELDGSYLPGFPLFVYDTNWSSPVVADIDNDGWLEIVSGGDIDPPCPNPGGTCNPAANEFGWGAGGVLWAVRHDGSVQPGFPINIVGQTLWSDPSLVDLDGDKRLDIVIGTGTNFGGNPDAGRRVYAYRSDGQPVAGWPAITDGQVMGSPAIGDLDNDGAPEVAVVSTKGRIFAFNHDGSELWNACNGDAGWNDACDKSNAVHGSVVIADVDNDGQQEVVNQAEHWMAVYDGASGAREDRKATLNGTWAPASAPTVVSIANETHILQSVLRDDGDGIRDAGDELVILDFVTGTPLGESDWPMLGRDAARTGYDVGAFLDLGFVDIIGTTFEGEINWLAGQNITSGCAAFPKAFCPDDAITRAQMATFLVKAFSLPPAPPGYAPFDDDGGVHQASIRSLAYNGVTSGCAAGPRSYCPQANISRAQMATFLTKSFGLPSSSTDWFDDDNGLVHEASIQALRASGITTGCSAGPRSYCPSGDVSREQMAAFLFRGFT